MRWMRRQRWFSPMWAEKAPKSDYASASARKGCPRLPCYPEGSGTETVWEVQGLQGPCLERAYCSLPYPPPDQSSPTVWNMRAKSESCPRPAPPCPCPASPSPWLQLTGQRHWVSCSGWPGHAICPLAHVFEHVFAVATWPPDQTCTQIHRVIFFPEKHSSCFESTRVFPELSTGADKHKA